MARFVDWVVAVAMSITLMEATVLFVGTVINTVRQPSWLAALDFLVVGSLLITVGALMHYSRKDFETQKRLKNGTPKRT